MKTLMVESDIGKDRYEKWFTLLLYISLCKDIGDWILSQTAGFTTDLFSAFFIFVLFFFSFYLLYILAKQRLKTKDQKYLCKFVYFMGLKL